MKKKHLLYPLLGTTLLLCGIYIGATYETGTSKTTEQAQDYPLLAKRIFVDNPNDARINFSGLRSSLNGYFKDNELKGSLYFEYLPTGTSVRVNPDARYTAASLIKLPVAMEFYKVVEQGKVNPEQPVALKEEWLDSEFGDLYKKGAGYSLPLSEAVEAMLRDSDNTALRTVIDSNNPNLTADNLALNSLDIEYNINDKDQTLQIGTRSYSSFLKCLYFACYNTKADSQEILQILSETKFDERLVAGITDESVRVSHKIGVFNSSVQSDCGIVYVPNSNYVLCVMIEAEDTDETNKRFEELSRIVYDFITTDN